MTRQLCIFTTWVALIAWPHSAQGQVSAPALESAPPTAELVGRILDGDSSSHAWRSLAGALAVAAYDDTAPREASRLASDLADSLAAGRPTTLLPEDLARSFGATLPAAATIGGAPAVPTVSWRRALVPRLPVVAGVGLALVLLVAGLGLRGRSAAHGTRAGALTLRLRPGAGRAGHRPPCRDAARLSARLRTRRAA